MKISKERLQQIIKEELKTLQEEEEKIRSFGSVRKTATDAKKDFRQRGEDAVDQADEYTNVERGIVQQINDILDDLAMEADIDKGQVRTELVLIFNRLRKLLLKIRKQQGKDQK